MTNLSGALLVCSQMGVEPVMFYEAIPSFTGAAKRLELFQIALQSASIEILHMRQVRYKQQLRLFVNNFQTIFSLLASSYILSSLDASFIQTYANCLAQSDIAVVFIDDEARKAKGKDPLDEQTIRSAFAHQSLYVFYENEALFNWLRQQPASIVLMMSSGHFGGLDLQRLVD